MVFALLPSGLGIEVGVIFFVVPPLKVVHFKLVYALSPTPDFEVGDDELNPILLNMSGMVTINSQIFEQLLLSIAPDIFRS